MERRPGMKQRVALLAVALLCVGAILVSGFSFQQGKERQATGVEETPDAKMAKPAQPGEQHERLKAMVGNWKMAGKSWMTPAMEPALWDGVSEKKMILGDRFLHEEVHSEMMGQTFTGIGILGYDNLQGKYQWIWMDDMSTGLMISEGTCDESGKTLIVIGEYMDPMTASMQIAKTVVSIVSEDEHVFEMYMKGPNGAEFKSMEISYERAE
jgi:hypothetical protein